MPKSEVPIDPMDGLPNVPLMVERGMSIREALVIWDDFRKSHHHPSQDCHVSQGQSQFVREPH